MKLASQLDEVREALVALGGLYVDLYVTPLVTWMSWHGIRVTQFARLKLLCSRGRHVDEVTVAEGHGTKVAILHCAVRGCRYIDVDSIQSIATNRAARRARKKLRSKAP